VPHDPQNTPSSRVAEELLQAARRAQDPDERLWRLEWAQVFQHLADVAKGRKDDKNPNAGG